MPLEHVERRELTRFTQAIQDAIDAQRHHRRGRRRRSTTSSSRRAPHARRRGLPQLRALLGRRVRSLAVRHGHVGEDGGAARARRARVRRSAWRQESITGEPFTGWLTAGARRRARCRTFAARRSSPAKRRCASIARDPFRLGIGVLHGRRGADGDQPRRDRRRRRHRRRRVRARAGARRDGASLVLDAAFAGGGHDGRRHGPPRRDGRLARAARAHRATRRGSGASSRPTLGARGRSTTRAARSGSPRTTRSSTRCEAKQRAYAAARRRDARCSTRRELAERRAEPARRPRRRACSCPATRVIYPPRRTRSAARRRARARRGRARGHARSTRSCRHGVRCGDETLARRRRRERRGRARRRRSRRSCRSCRARDISRSPTAIPDSAGISSWSSAISTSAHAMTTRVGRVQRAAARDGTGADRLVARARGLGRVDQPRRPARACSTRAVRVHAGARDAVDRSARGPAFVRRRRTSCRSSAAGQPTPGLWIAAGHEGLGITTSLGTARAARRPRGRPRSRRSMPAPFAPMRVLAGGRSALMRAPDGLWRVQHRRRRAMRVRVAAGIDRRRRAARRRRACVSPSVSGEPRAPLCGMGICYECRVTIDGVAAPARVSRSGGGRDARIARRRERRSARDAGTDVTLHRR